MSLLSRGLKTILSMHELNANKLKKIKSENIKLEIQADENEKKIKIKFK